MSDIKNVLGKEEFDEIINSQIPVLVDFYATWCGPCKMQAPIVDELATDVGDKAIIAKVNTDDCYDICVKYRIASIPTILIFKNGELVDKSVGLTSKTELLNLINKNI